MTIKVLSVQPRDQMNKVLAKVSFHDPDGPPHNSAIVDVFVDYTDSYAELRRRSIMAARSFFEKALAAEPVEKKE